MEGQNIVQLGFNVEELSAQKKQVLDLFVDLFGKLQEYDGTKFNPLGNGGLADFKKSITDGAAVMDKYGQSVQKYNELITKQYQAQQGAKKSTDDLSAAEKQHQKNLQDTIATKAKISEADTNAANDRAIEIQRLKAVNAEVNANAKVYLSQIGSVNEAKATIAQLKIERDKENASTEEGKAKIIELNAAIDKNNQFINENTAKIEQQKNNVGNYTGALQVLESALIEVNAKMGQVAAAGNQGSEAYARLAEESGLLSTLVTQQQHGFASVTQEIRNSERALQTLRASGFGASESFEKLRDTTVEANREQKEFQRQQKLLEGEAPLLQALTVAAKGLAGAYAIGQGSVTLFADGNEKAQKELNKLVAIMTILQGLNEAYQLIQQAGAISTAIRTATVKAATAVQSAFAGSVTETAIANDALLASEAPVIAATEGEAAALAETTIAAEGATVAIADAAVATEALGTAILATGIGAAIAVVAAAIVYLISKIPDWIKGDAILLKQQQEISEAMKKANEATIEQARFMSELDQATKKYYENQLALSGAAGLNEEKNFALRKALGAEELRLSQNDVDALGASYTGNARLAESIQLLNDKRQEAIDIQLRLLSIPEQKQTSDQKDELAAAKKNEEFYNKALEAPKVLYEASKKALADRDANRQKVAQDELKEEKFNADERRKIVLESAKLEADAITNKNSIILSNEFSTSAQRIAAIKSNAQQERKITEAEKNNVLSDQGVSSGTKLLAVRKAAEEDRKIRLDEQEKTTKELIAARDRVLNAQASINKNADESDSSKQEAITKDIQKDLDDRLAALRKNLDDKTKIIADNYNLQLKLNTDLSGKSKLTDKELEALERDKDAQLIELTANTQKEIYETTVSYAEKKLKDVEEINKASNSSNAVDAQYEVQLSALNKSLINNKISYDKYLRDKEKLDKDYIAQKDAADVADDKASLERLKKAEADEIQVKLDAAKIQLDAAKSGGDDSEIKNAQAKYDALLSGKHKFDAEINTANEKADKDEIKAENDKIAAIQRAEQKLSDNKKQIALDSFSLAKQLVDASYEIQINRIQHLTDIQDQASENEIQAIARSTLSTRQQAEEEIIISAQQRARDKQAKKEELDLKIKAAKFDRDVAVAEIIWNTGRAIMHDTAAVPFPLNIEVAATDAALGAIQAAIVLARPIPTYAEGIGIPGKGQHPGGYAWAGEEFKPELVSMPGHAPFIVDKPTLLNMPAMTSVLPISTDDIVFELGGIGARRGMAQINNYQERNTNVEDAIRIQTAQLTRAFRKSQKKIVNVISINPSMAGLSSEYVNKKILGKG